MSSGKLRIQIPATSSNLGAGFDCFGLALNLFNEYDIEFTKQDDEFQLESNLPDNFCSKGKDNLFYQCFRTLLTKNQITKLPGLKVRLNAQVPMAGGFGSSSTAVLAGLITANQVLDNKYSEHDLLKEACFIEKHPDNVCASMLGGFCLSSFDGDKLTYKKIDWKLDLDILMLFPLDFRVDTQKARKALKANYSLEDCVFNISNSALFTAAVLDNDLELFTKVIVDKIHEPYRLALIPGASEIIEMAKKNRALGATISGSGASLIIFLEAETASKLKSNAQTIKDQAQVIWTKNKLEASSLLCKVSNSGALIY